MRTVHLVSAKFMESLEVTHYLIYLADDEDGANRSLLGNVSATWRTCTVSKHIAIEANKANMLRLDTPGTLIR